MYIFGTAEMFTSGSERDVGKRWMVLGIALRDSRWIRQGERRVSNFGGYGVCGVRIWDRRAQ